MGRRTTARARQRPRAFFAARLVTKSWAKVRVYRFLVLVVILSIVYLLIVDDTKILQHI